MNYKNEYNSYINESKKFIPVIIDNNYIINRSPTGGKDGDSHSIEYSFGICGLDVSKTDMSNLTVENFAKLSFDTNTIFSEEQLKKFHPIELLEKGKIFGLGIEKLHKAGITGEGVQIAIIDEPFDIDTPEMKNIEYAYEDSRIPDQYKKVDNMHGRTVTSLLHSISPKATINFHAVQVIEQTEESTKEINSKRKEILDECLKSDENVSVISMSASIGEEETSKYDEMLDSKKICFVNSDSLHKYFTYAERDGLNDKIKAKRVSVNKEKFEKYKKTSLEMLPEMKLEYEKIKDKNSKNKLQKLINTVTACLNIKTPVEMSDFLTEQKDEELKRQGKILIPNGGETYPQIGGGYKYNGVPSMSWTIPQLSGMLALAKQMDKNISYYEFVEVSKITAIINEEGFLIINPEGIVRKINQINKQKACENPQIYTEIYEKSNKLISNLDRVKDEENKDNKFISELKGKVVNKEDVPKQFIQSEENELSKEKIKYDQQEI